MGCYINNIFLYSTRSEELARELRRFLDHHHKRDVRYRIEHFYRDIYADHEIEDNYDGFVINFSILKDKPEYEAIMNELFSEIEHLMPVYNAWTNEEYNSLWEQDGHSRIPWKFSCSAMFQGVVHY